LFYLLNIVSFFFSHNLFFLLFFLFPFFTPKIGSIISKNNLSKG